ncbi:uncharacterized protein B0P05DRAFT_596582 [Gilbertella persicaria]|uniref:uncharacterized protein n=1 Tax=Gilbertella persicaria TaxID=101096 RepID=UPI00221F5207|nr:uncharacterized protein B0P05DRAFT_596582 [Gilbertella persicaria]KAI8080265.1 hypothetical protein B0P05DRAFT_596582 [Gilbertella persicaria]
MDPEEVESFMEQLDNDSEQQQESDNEKQESDDEEQENDNKIVEEEEDATMEESKQASVPSEQQNTARQFRDLYMSKVTQAFGSDLDQIRQEPTLNGPRLNILIDSLEAGIDIFSSLEQEIILADEQKIIK